MRARRRRSLLTGLGIALAAAMLVGGAGRLATASAFGFDRAARAADLPDIIVRFDPQIVGRASRSGSRRCPTSPPTRCAPRSPTSTVRPADQFARRRRSSRSSARAGAATRSSPAAICQRARARCVVERGVRPRVGPAARRRRFDIDGLGPQRVVGFSESPDNVSYPARGAARLRLGARQFGADPNPQVNLAEIWLRDPRIPERGARPGARDELRPAGPAVRHPLGGAGAARPGGRNRDRPAGGAVADRARHRGRDARRVGARRGPAPARARSASGARSGASRGHLAGSRRRRGAVRRGAGGDASARSAARSPPTARRRGCSCCSTSPRPGSALAPPLVGSRGWRASRSRCWRRRGRRGAPRAGRRWRCCAAPSSRRRPAASRPRRPSGCRAARRPDRARRPARRRAPDAAGRDRRRRSGSRPRSCC